jgi:CheY-like chemotaxis protein
MLAMWFTLQGCETRTVHDGGSAVRSATEFRPDLILLDIGMPDIDGYDTCRRIRAGHDLPASPLIVAVTGWGQEDDRRRSAEAGFDLHLVKPVPSELLANLLTQTPSPQNDF